MFRRRGGYRRVDTTSDDVPDTDEAYRENGIDDRSRYASEISSSLSLQVLIYYNVLLSAVYFVLEGGLVVEKVNPSCSCTKPLVTRHVGLLQYSYAQGFIVERDDARVVSQHLKP